jgi:hypothetical protein
LADRQTPELIDFYGCYLPGAPFTVGHRPGRNRSLACGLRSEYRNGATTDRGARVARERSVAGQVEGQRSRRPAGVDRRRIAITRAVTADSSSRCAMRSPLRLVSPCKPCSIYLPKWTHPCVQSRVLAGSARALRIACSCCPMVRPARPLPSEAVLATGGTDLHKGLLPRLRSLSMPHSSGAAAAPASRVVEGRPSVRGVEVTW